MPVDDPVLAALLESAQRESHPAAQLEKALAVLREKPTQVKYPNMFAGEVLDIFPQQRKELLHLFRIHDDIKIGEFLLKAETTLDNDWVLRAISYNQVDEIRKAAERNVRIERLRRQWVDSCNAALQATKQPEGRG